MNQIEPAPDPTKPKPDNWPFDEKRWPAYRIVVTGGTRADAAKAAGTSLTTLKRWQRAWEAHYDTTQTATTRPGITPANQQLGTDAAAAAKAATELWKHVRQVETAKAESEIENLDALVAALDAGPLSPTSPRINTLTAVEAMRIRLAAIRSKEIEIRMWDRLAGIPELSRVQVDADIEVDASLVVTPGVLDALYGPDAEPVDDVLDDLDEIIGDTE